MKDDGLKNVKAIAIKIDKTKSRIMNKGKVTGVKSYHSFVFEDEDMKLYSYYNIGQGKSEKYNEVQYIPATELVTPWIASTRQGVDMIQAQQNVLYACPETKCKASFKNEQQLNDHVASGNHDLVEPTKHDQILDMFVLQKYANELEHAQVKDAYKKRQLSELEKQKYQEYFKQGFALPIIKRKKFSDKQKNFVKQIFDEGNKNKVNKKTPEQIAQLMKADNNFRLRECLTTAQIKGVISNFIKKQRNTEEIEEIEEFEDEVML